MKDTAIKVGFLTISDRAYQGEYTDIGGGAMKEWVAQALLSPYELVSEIIPDEQAAIEHSLIYLCDEQKCDLILTTGGTGPALRDVTPEATRAVCERIYDGFAQQMRTVSLKTVPTAILSRQLAGSRGKSCIINLPGKPDSISVCLSAIFLAVPKMLELLSGVNIQIDLNFIES